MLTENLIYLHINFFLIFEKARVPNLRSVCQKSCHKPKHTNLLFLLHSSWHFLITPYNKVQIYIIIGDPSLWMEIRRPLPFHCRLLWKSTLELPSTQNSRIQAGHSESKDKMFERIIVALSGPLCIIYMWNSTWALLNISRWQQMSGLGLRRKAKEVKGIWLLTYWWTIWTPTYWRQVAKIHRKNIVQSSHVRIAVLAPKLYYFLR